MLNQAYVLVAEDQSFIALDLAFAIEDANGQVVGPAASCKEALSLLRSTPVAGAILDINLADGECLPIIERLHELGVPMVVQTGKGLPPSIAARFPELRANLKPCLASALVEQLVALMAVQPRAAGR